MTQALAYLFYFVAATVGPIQRRWLLKTKEGGNKLDFSFKISLIAAVLSLLLPLFYPFHFQGNLREILLFCALGGLSGVFFYLCQFAAQGHVEAGTTSVLGNTYTPVTIVLSTLFLGEGLTERQLIGTLLLLAAAIIVSKKHRTGKLTYDKHFWLMLMSGVFLAGLLVSGRELMKITGFTASTILLWSSLAFFLGLATLVTRGTTTYTGKEILLTGVLKVFQDLSWVILTYVVGNLSLVSAVTTFKIVVIFVVAALFLGEREDMKRKIIGSLVAVGGLLLMR